MASNDLLRIADSGEIDAGIPAKKEVEVGLKLWDKFLRSFGAGEKRREQLGDAGSGEHESHSFRFRGSN